MITPPQSPKTNKKCPSGPKKSHFSEWTNEDLKAFSNSKNGKKYILDDVNTSKTNIFLFVFIIYLLYKYITINNIQFL